MPCKGITIYCYLITLCLPPLTIETTYVLLLLYCEACVVIMLCQPVGQPEKCCTKRHLELRDIATGCMTFECAADMSARLVIVSIHMPICQVF